MSRASAADVASRSRAALVAWLILGCAAALSVGLVSMASTTTRETRRAVGNGLASYLDVDTTFDAGIAAVAWAALTAGLVTWAVILVRSRGGRLAVAAAAAGVAVTGYLWVASPLLAGDGFSDAERFQDTGEVVAALARAGMPCSSAAPAPAGPRGDLFMQSRTCGQPNPADIRDGHDEVLVQIFASSSARDRWTETVAHDDVYAVIGPTWVATCRFEGTCARIQASIGGRNY